MVSNFFGFALARDSDSASLLKDTEPGSPSDYSFANTFGSFLAESAVYFTVLLRYKGNEQDTQG